MVPLLSAMRTVATELRLRAIFWTRCQRDASPFHSSVGRASERMEVGKWCCMCNVCASFVRLLIACARECVPGQGSGSVARKGAPWCMMVTGSKAKWPSTRRTGPAADQRCRCSSSHLQGGRSSLFSCLLDKRSKARRTLRGAEETTLTCARMALRSQELRLVLRTMRLMSVSILDFWGGSRYGTVSLAGRHSGMFIRAAMRSTSLVRTAA